jgi:ribosomal protein S16
MDNTMRPACALGLEDAGYYIKQIAILSDRVKKLEDENAQLKKLESVSAKSERLAEKPSKKWWS